MSRKDRRDRKARQMMREFLDGSHWSFLCFTPERAEKAMVMLCELIVETGQTLSIGRVYFPPGTLWNGRECNAMFVPKAQLAGSTLARGLRKHFGYENPEPESDVFTLGVTPEEDAALDRVGLFGQKKAS
jgi:hypothetical protein